MKGATFDKARAISFSDTIFSIAMALLVLKVVIPSYKELKTGNTLKILQDRIASFISLVVSFMVTALYWVAQMRILKYVSASNIKVLWYNIGLLFFIIILPFSTESYVKEFMLKGPFAFYCFNLFAISFFNYLLNIYIPKIEKRKTRVTSVLAKYFKLGALNTFVIWALASLLAFYTPIVARFLFLILFVIEAILSNIYEKKLLLEANVQS